MSEVNGKTLSISFRIDEGVIEHNNRIFIAKNVDGERVQDNITYCRQDIREKYDDAYEYLMRNFASESGKSKGQFYTPAEVSRILAKVIGIDHCKNRDACICDPACGSGSLLIRAMAEAPFDIDGCG